MNSFTQKLAGRGEIDLIGRGLMQPPKESNSCEYELICEDVRELRKLEEDKESGGRLEDLKDQYKNVCSNLSAVEDCSKFKELRVLEKIEDEGIREYYESPPIFLGVKK